MYIKDYNNLCQVTEVTMPEHLRLYDMLRILDDARFFSPKYKKGYWDGYHTFYSKKNRTFPTGLLPMVTKAFPHATVERVAVGAPFSIDFKLNHMTPRQDQVDLITTALQTNRGLIKAPTSFGKTCCMAMICKSIKEPILIITHTKTLLYQTVENLQRELNEPIGIIGDGKASVERVTIGLIRSLENFEVKANCIIVDECHRCSADGLYEYLLRNRAFYRYGFSADPLDDQAVKANTTFKNLRIIGAFGQVISHSSMAQAKKDGIIASPIITLIKVKDPYNGQYQEASYPDAYEALVVQNVNLLGKIKELCTNNAGSQIMILLKRIEQGKILEATIPNSKFLSGELSSDVINQAILDYKKGAYSVLIGSDIFKEGVDIPQIDVLINAGGDIAATKQRLGRGLRKKEGKDTIAIYDFYIRGNKHMEKHTKERLKIYVAEGHDVVGYNT